MGFWLRFVFLFSFFTHTTRQMCLHTIGVSYFLFLILLLRRINLVEVSSCS